jgi:hypothetical protein
MDLNHRPPGPELGINHAKSLSWRHLRFSGRSQLDKFGQVPVDVLASQLGYHGGGLLIHSALFGTHIHSFLFSNLAASQLR